MKVVGAMSLFSPKETNNISGKMLKCILVVNSNVTYSGLLGKHC